MFFDIMKQQGEEMPGDNLIDITKNNKNTEPNIKPVSNLGDISAPAVNQPVASVSITPEPVNFTPESTIQGSNESAESVGISPISRKTKWWVMVLVVMVLLFIGGAVWYYLTFVSSEEARVKAFQKGPNLQIYKKDILFFGYSEYLNAFIYQKNDKNIYGDFLEFDKKDFQILNSYGARLVSISPYSQYAVVTYDKAPVVEAGDSDKVKSLKNLLKDSKGNHYMIDLEKNTFYNLGANINNIFWSPDKLFLVRNFKELLTYDFRLANYSAPIYQGPIEPYYKIFDFRDDITFIDYSSVKNTVYLISVASESGKPALFSFDISKKEFKKIIETQANAFSFSPSGKYMILYNTSERNNIIYKTADFTEVTTITNNRIVPYNTLWTEDEKKLYYFSQNDDYFKSENSEIIAGKDGFEGVYSDLIKYDLETNKREIVLSGQKNNIASPTSMNSNLKKNQIYFNTMQNNNVYRFEIK